MIPSDNVCNSQFGFREGRSTALGCTLLNDVSAYFRDRGSPVYICSLDAEKCFDSIWHDALLQKLWDVIPRHHWLLIHRWYKSLTARVRWNGDHSHQFTVTRGTRQGSVLSPHFFGIFINELLVNLKCCDNGLRIGRHQYESFAYADDITLYSATVPGLQRMIDMCVEYAESWRFKFGIKKSKCMISGKPLLNTEPYWHLGPQTMINTDKLEILGVIFSADGQTRAYAEHRMKKCRGSYFSLDSSGMAYPGLPVDIKAHMWNSICRPTLTYGLETVTLSETLTRELESLQGFLIKRSLGLSKYSHHTKLLQAMNIPSVGDTIKLMTVSLWKRTFKVDSPLRNLCSFFISKYIATGISHPGTLTGRIIQLGLSPIATALTSSRLHIPQRNEDGAIDSLRRLIMENDFNNRESLTHRLVALLVRV